MNHVRAYLTDESDVDTAETSRRRTEIETDARNRAATVRPIDTPAAHPPAALDLRRLTLADRVVWARLLAGSFGRTQHQMELLLDWFHAGFELITMGAWDGPHLVAQYNARLLDLDVPAVGGRISAGMGLNMVVDPAYRGRGLLRSVSAPVHEELARRGCIAGVGFSSAGGLAVTRSSASYGYRVLGPMTSTVTFLAARRARNGFELSDTFPTGHLALPESVDDGMVRYAVSEASLRHRFADHPFRRYVFGASRDGGTVTGLTVHREIRLRGVPAVGLLAAYAEDPAKLLSEWAAAVRRSGRLVAHVVTSPESTLRRALPAAGPSVAVPFGRDRYHLICRGLRDDTPALLFALDRWDCAGGDIL